MERLGWLMLSTPSQVAGKAEYYRLLRCLTFDSIESYTKNNFSPPRHVYGPDWVD
jgi:hypothetical protein